MPDTSLLVFLALVCVAASTGVLFRPGEWYESLNKPSWIPPNIAFPVVWTVLYILIAIAGWLVWEAGGGNVALLFWALQLALNSAWSYLFFGARRSELAFADITLLWVAVAGFIAAAWPVSPAASLLFLPYLAWVTLAALLVRELRRLNADLP